MRILCVILDSEYTERSTLDRLPQITYYVKRPTNKKKAIKIECDTTFRQSTLLRLPSGRFRIFLWHYNRYWDESQKPSKPPFC